MASIESNVTMTNCTIDSNAANTSQGGGGVYFDSGKLYVLGCRFTSNFGGTGAALVTANAAVSVTNCVFQSNAAARGGGIAVLLCSGTVTNCTFNGNIGAFQGGAMYSNTSTVSVTNSILWADSSPIGPELDGTATVTYSCVQGGLSGTGNISTDPHFVSASDLRLQTASPCIDVGTSVGAPAVDISGTARPKGAGFDLGAYEFSTSPVLISGPTAAPNPSTIGQTVSFSAAATDADGDAVSYNWDFGDGSSATGATPTHAFTTAGAFMVKVVAINAGDPVSATATNSGAVTVTVTINSRSGIPGDSDGDGVIDEIEIAMGSNAFDADSLPAGMSKMTGLQNLSVSKLNVKLDFTRHGNDSIGLSGLILIPDGFKVSGQMFVVDIGGVVKSFTLDAKGSATSGGSSIKVPVKSGKAGTPLQISKYSAKFSKGTFADTLASAGLVNATTTAKLNVLVTVIFNGQVWQKSVPQSYVAKKDKGGVTK